jgi:DNA-binding MarR family transcriptional regulator
VADDVPADAGHDTQRRIIFMIRAMLSESDRMAQVFADMHRMTVSDFRALLHIVVAEEDGVPLTASDVRKRLNVSAGAVTYIVDRLVRAGHVRREQDPSDRRKAILRYSERGHHLAGAYFSPIGATLRDALVAFSDEEIDTTERVLEALLGAMRKPLPQ